MIFWITFVNKLKVYIIFTSKSTLKVHYFENVALNIKLRSLFLKNVRSFFTSGFYCSSLFSTAFITLNPTKLIGFFESKRYFFALQNLLYINPLIIFGSSYNNTYFKQELTFFFKNLLPTCLVFSLTTAANVESSYFFNVSSLNSHLIQKSTSLLAFNLKNTFNFLY